MGTCAKCGDDFPETAILECPDCGESYCRHDYHGHDCDPAVPGAASGGGGGSDDVDEESVEATTSTSGSLGDTFAAFGNLVVVLAGACGLLFLGLEIDAVLFGAQGVDAIQAVMHLVVAAALFSFATLVLVASYVGSRA